MVITGGSLTFITTSVKFLYAKIPIRSFTLTLISYVSTSELPGVPVRFPAASMLRKSAPPLSTDQRKKYAAKANNQLVSTGQAVQVACPVSGKKVNKDVKLKLAGVDVAFFCGGCRSEVAEAKADQQVQLVFGNEPFKKSYEIKKQAAKAQKPERQAKKEQPEQEEKKS